MCLFGLLNTTNVHPGSNVTFQPAFKLISAVKQTKNISQELYPSFKELSSWLEDESEITHLSVIKYWLDHQISPSKDRQFNKTNNDSKKNLS